MMRMRRISASALIFLTLALCLFTARPSYLKAYTSDVTPVHDLNTGQNYTTISDAVTTAEIMPGDLNQDRTVNIGDATILADKFDLAQNQAAQVSLADINGDSRADILNAIILGNNFGRTWQIDP